MPVRTEIQCHKCVMYSIILLPVSSGKLNMSSGMPDGHEAW